MSVFAQSDEPDTQDYSYVSPDPATTTPPIAPEQSTSSDAEASHSRNRSNNPLLGKDHGLVSELEQEVLDEYSRLLRNVNQVRRRPQAGIDASSLGHEQTLPTVPPTRALG